MGGGFGSPELSVDQAYGIDVKMDDGIASTGRVFSINDNWDVVNCVDGDLTGAGASTSRPYDYILTDTAQDCMLTYIIH